MNTYLKIHISVFTIEMLGGVEEKGWSDGAGLLDLIACTSQLTEPSFSLADAAGARSGAVFTKHSFLLYRPLGCIDAPQRDGKFVAYGLKQFVRRLLIRKLLREKMSHEQICAVIAGRDTGDLMRWLLEGIEIVSVSVSVKVGRTPFFEEVAMPRIFARATLASHAAAPEEASQAGTSDRQEQSPTAPVERFVDGKDFKEIPPQPGENDRGEPCRDFRVSVECAKHIVMMEQPEQGHQILQCLVEYEKALRVPESENTTQAPVVVPVSGAALSLGMKDEPTMSSREIAELCEKDHRNVLRDIRAVLEEAEIGALKFERTYLDAQNKERPCFHLPRFECDLVVSGYSVKYRAAIIRRWHELEAKEAQGVPQTFSEALRLAADLAKQSEKQMLQL